MAVATYQANINADRSVTVSFGTGDALGSNEVAILFDNTASFNDVRQALTAALRAFNREASKVSDPADMATSGLSTE